MSHKKLKQLFVNAEDEFIEFDRIPVSERRHERPDLCAFLYLHEKLGGEGDAVGAADHDEIWLSFENLERLTAEDVVYIHRCGVRYSEENESLCMFA